MDAFYNDKRFVYSGSELVWAKLLKIPVVKDFYHSAP